MSKLYKLREWFSLEDAAKRLSSGLEEPVTTADVLQLVIEGHISLSWYARHVAAERVARACVLPFMIPSYNLFQKDNAPKRYFGEVWWRGDVAYRSHAGWKRGDALKPYACINWLPIHEKETIERITGVYRLELDECGALKDWVHSLLTDTGGALITLDGYFVSDDEGTVWRILEHNPGGAWEARDGTRKTIAPFYHPSGAFPDLAELVIKGADIEAFERSVTLGSQAALSKIDSREKQTLFNIVGGLLDLMLGSTPAGKPQSVFTSQATIIDALLANYEGKQGIAKRTLEEKFAQARRGFAPD